MNTLPHIDINHLTKRYGDTTAVDELTLSVTGGSVLCFLGPNGAGKTTTIHIIVGLKNPTAGDVHINGVSVGSPDIHRVRRGVGYLAEQPMLYDFLTGREFLRFVGELYDVGPERFRWIEEQIERFDLSGEADALTRTYSMGTKKKVALLAAFVHDPDIILLDEPTGGLDVTAARAAKDLMTHASDRGKLVFFTTHVMEIAERLADRIAIVDRGRLAADGTLEELRDAYGHGPGEPLEDVFLRITSRTSSGTAPS